MKKPLPLKNLPDYIKSLKEKNEADDSLIVDMGQVTSETPYSTIFKRYAAATVVLLVFFGFFGIYYKSLSKDVTVTLTSGGDIQTVSEIISDDGGEIINVEQMPDLSYKIRTKNLKNSFIEKLRNHKDVEKVEVE